MKDLRVKRAIGAANQPSANTDDGSKARKASLPPQYLLSCAHRGDWGDQAAVTRSKRMQRWFWALGVSATVHLLILLILVQQQPYHRLMEMPSVEVIVRRPIEPDRPEPKPKPIDKPPPPSPPPPAVTARPVETPSPVPSAPVAPARGAPPQQPVAPAPPAQAARDTGPMKLGCDARSYDKLTREQKAACMRSVTSLVPAPKAGQPPIAQNDRDKEFAAQKAANEARDAQHAQGDAKAFGCPEANLGVGCTSDRLVPLIKQKF